MNGLVAPAVSIVICAYTDDRWALLVQAVESALREASDCDQIVVVVDHNESLLARVEAEFRARPQVLVARNGQSRGLSGARNTGTALAHNAIVAFVDDDAMVQPRWRQAMLRHYESVDVAAVGGHAEAVWPSERPQWLPPECDWVVGCSHAGLPDTVAAVRNVIGCNMSFRREMLLAVGGFNTTIGRVGRHPVGCEETECCIRIRQRLPGVRVVFDPQIRVRHFVSIDRTRIGYLVKRSFGEGISKRKISVLVGGREATSAERSYLSSDVPRALARGVRESFSPRSRRRSPGGLARASALALSIGAAGMGYLYAFGREVRSPDGRIAHAQR